MENKRIDLDKYLSTYSDDMSSLARDLRNRILQLVPELDELIKWKNLFYERTDLYVQLYCTRTMLT